MKCELCPRARVTGEHAICMAPGGPQGNIDDVISRGCGGRLVSGCDRLADRQETIQTGGEDPLKGTSLHFPEIGVSYSTDELKRRGLTTNKRNWH